MAMMRTVLLLMLSFVAAGLDGQPLLFENYSSKQGLSQNSCFTISQDSHGCMWFGTQDGLNRYDGKQFKIYLPQTPEGRRLPSNYISSLFFSRSDDLLWVGTMGGLCLYVPKGDSLAAVADKFPFAGATKNIPIKKILSFSPGQYWIVTFNKGLIYLNTKTKTLRSYFDDTTSRSQVNSVASLNGKIIAATAHRLFTLDPDSNRPVFDALNTDFQFPEIKELYTFNGALWIGTLTGGCYYIHLPLKTATDIHHFATGTDGIGCFTTDRAGCLWIGSRGGGILRYSPATGQLTQARHNPYDRRSPGKDFVLSLFRGREGIIWCGLSGSGIAKYDPLKFQFQTLEKEAFNPMSLQDNMVFTLFKSSSGKYYVGTQNKGVLEWNRQSGAFKAFDGIAAYGPAASTVYGITEDQYHRLWLASWAGLLELDPRTGTFTYFGGSGSSRLPSKKFYAILKLRYSDSLLLTGEQGAAFFSLKNKKWQPCAADIFQNSLYTGRYLYQDSSGVIWICTTGAGLVKYDLKSMIATIIQPIRRMATNTRHLLAAGSLFWIATDNGVLVYDRRSDRVIRHIIPGDKNASQVCYAIQKDQAGFFWVSSNTGLYKINPVTFSVQKNYNLGNGLSFLEYNTACCAADMDGTLLFGGIEGITAFNPALLKANSFSPAPMITGIRVGEKAFPTNDRLLQSGLSLKHNENFLTIQFAAANFSNEANNLFKWRLKGLSNNWTSPSETGSASFSSLPPGSYVFELRAANSDGKWSSAYSAIPVTVHPPWWQTWIFRMTVAGTLSLLIYYGVSKRAQAIRKDSALKQQLAELEMKGLHAQMNPHFIFNSLNSIKEMIWNDDKISASRYLSKFAQLIRTSLEHSRQTFITVEQCISHLQQYLEMEQLRFDGFAYAISLDDKLDANEAQIAPMLVQPLVENAIWHGLHGKAGDRLLFIRFSGSSRHLICEIEDNGIGILKASQQQKSSVRTHQSLGIINIKERLAVLNEKYHMNCSLDITDKSATASTGQHGTLAVFQFIT